MENFNFDVHFSESMKENDFIIQWILRICVDGVDEKD